MKRCPECGRNYNDDSMSFCLDDGSELLFGPASMDEPATAKFTPPVSPDSLDTKLLNVRDSLESKKNPPRRVWLLFALGAVFIVALFGIGYLRFRDVSNPAAIRSLTVLPLRPIVPGDDYMGLGIADAIIRRLSQTGKVTVRPTSAIRRFVSEEKDGIAAATDLNTDAVLEGTFQRFGDKIRVSVNLLRVSDGQSLWTENFDLKSEDIFATQDSVAQQVAARLRLGLDAEQLARINKHSTSNPMAYEYYTKGIYSFDLRGLGSEAKPQALATAEFFKKAIELDPQFALAKAQLAYVYSWIGLFIEPNDQSWFRLARVELAATEKLDSNIAELHLARAMLLTSAAEGWQYEAAARELKTAQQIDPSVGHTNLGDIYYHIGLNDLALAEFKKALEIDPTSKWTKSDIRFFYDNLREFDNYLETTQRYFPNEPIWVSYYTGKSMFAEAEKASDIAIAQSPDSGFAWADRAMLLAAQNDVKGAEEIISKIMKGAETNNLTYHHLTYKLACTYALLGKNDEAVRWLRETADKGFSCLPLFEKDRYLDGIRKYPAYIELMARLKERYDRNRIEFDRVR